MEDWRSPRRAQVSSTYTLWKRTPTPICLAKAAVMITSERQLPLRASNASAALRVIAESYSSLRWASLRSASTSVCCRPFDSGAAAIPVAM